MYLTIYIYIYICSLWDLFLKDLRKIIYNGAEVLQYLFLMLEESDADSIRCCFYSYLFGTLSSS